MCSYICQFEWTVVSETLSPSNNKNFWKKEVTKQLVRHWKIEVTVSVPVCRTVAGSPGAHLLAPFLSHLGCYLHSASFIEKSGTLGGQYNAVSGKSLFWLPVTGWSPNTDTMKLLYIITFRLCLWWLWDRNEFMFRFGPIPKISHYVNVNILKSETNVNSQTFLSPGISDEGCSTSNSLLPDVCHSLAPPSQLSTVRRVLLGNQMGCDHLVS